MAGPVGAGYLPTASFVDRDSATVRAGLTAVAANGLRLTGEYGVAFGDRTTDRTVQAKLSLAF